MNLTRHLVGAVAAALIGATTALVSAPATVGPATAAAAPVPTRIRLADQSKPIFKHGQTIIILGAVEGQHADGTWQSLPDTAAGAVTVYRAFPGGGYVRLGARTDEGGFSIATTAVRNATYKLVYDGADHITSVETYSYAPVTATRTLRISRNEHARVTSSPLMFVGNVDPGWARSYVTIQKKNCLTCSWAFYRRALTNDDGVFRARLGAPSSGRWYFRTYIPATSPHYAPAYSSVWYTYMVYARRA